MDELLTAWPPVALRRLRWLLILIIGWFLWVSVLLSETGTGPIGGMLLLFSWVVVGCAAFIELATFMVMLIVRRRVLYLRIHLMVYALIAILIALVFWFEQSHYPVLVRIKLNEHALLSYVESQQGQAGRAEAEPQIRGLFLIQRTEVRGSTVWMVTKICGLFSDECGLVYSPSGKPEYISEDYYGHLDGPWWIWRRSW